jgi:eukaryotic-like serine/threonine-protein kinase
MRDSSSFTSTISLAESEGSNLGESFPALPLVSMEHYAIEGLHARGGLGRILRARDLRLGRVVALKELVHHDRVSKLRFAREIQLTARLQHPSIVPVYEAGRWPNGTLFYAMKLITGRSLKELLGYGCSLDARLALLPHVVAVAEAIAYAHSERIIHRDIKPSNVIVGSFGETIVLDWGLAKNLDDVPVTHRSTPDEPWLPAGPILGTPAYMPPEQARGAQVDERADVYGLGAMVYHLLAGVPPFVGTSESIVAAVTRERPVPVSDREPSAPPALAAIVAKAMAAQPSDRHSSAGQLADDLHEFCAAQLARTTGPASSRKPRTWRSKFRWD